MNESLNETIPVACCLARAEMQTTYGPKHRKDVPRNGWNKRRTNRQSEGATKRHGLDEENWTLRKPHKHAKRGKPVLNWGDNRYQRVLDPYRSSKWLCGYQRLEREERFFLYCSLTIAFLHYPIHRGLRHIKKDKRRPKYRHRDSLALRRMLAAVGCQWTYMTFFWWPWRSTTASVMFCFPISPPSWKTIITYANESHQQEIHR